MTKKWAVLVVHGVGDTEPGATVDRFLGTLTAGGRRLHPDGGVEIRHFPDLPPGQPKAADDVALFPAHIRRAAIVPRSGGPAAPAVDEPREAVFAEVYWADLSRVREGTVPRLLGLLSTDFSLRYITDQAAVMPAGPATPAETNARNHSRWLRFLLSLAARILCGPIAALSGFLACTLALDDLLALWSPHRARGPAELAMLLLSVSAAAAGGFAWGWARRKESGTTWTWLWGWFGGVGVVSTGLVIWHNTLAS
jgi:hypothetical protein